MPVSHTNPHKYLVSCQDPEGCHNLLGSVCVSGLSGHEVNERLERDDSGRVGVYQHHDTGKLHLSLRRAQMENESFYSVLLRPHFSLPT